MHHHANTPVAWRLTHVILCIALLASIAAAPLAAQGWEVVYGSNHAVGEVGKASIESANGQIVTVGGGAGMMFVLRTTAFGNFSTQTAIPLNNYRSTYAIDVKEYSNGDLAIVGEAIDFNGMTHGIVMRTTSIGAPIWSRDMSDPQHHVNLTGVVIAQYGSGAAQPDDIVLCGRWGLFGGPEGIMARFEGSTGNLVWFKNYDINFTGGVSTEELNGLDECRVAGPGQGNIVATGTVAGMIAGVDVPTDIWVIRVDGDNGTATGPGLGSAIYSTPGNDYADDIRELSNGVDDGNLLVVGSSDGRIAAGGPRDLLMLEVTPDPCSPNSDAFIWDNSGQHLDASGVCEITPGVGGNVGNVVVAGSRFNGPFGQIDILSLEVQPGALNPVGNFHYYGENGDDMTFSISEVENAPNSQGFVLAGFTTSTNLLPVGHVRNAFILKNFNFLGNNCVVPTAAPSQQPAGMAVDCVPTTENNTITINTPVDVPLSNSWTWKHHCLPDAKPVTPQETKGAGNAAIASLDAFPRPIISGESFSVGYTLTAPATARVTVADMLGRIIHQSSGERSEGATTELVKTTGWSTGTYVVTVSVGRQSSTTRVVVMER